MRKFICIQCPMGCEIIVSKDGTKIEGNKCPRGKEYVIQEMTSPKRVLTTTVFIEKGLHPMLPVRSDGELPKELLGKCMKILAGVKVRAPVKRGDVIYENILGTGVNIVASRSMEEK